MQTVIIVIHLFIVLIMIGFVLVQRSEGGGLGMGGGAGFMSTRGSANFLTRVTAVLAGLFFVTSLLLSILAGMDRRPSSILKDSAPTGQSGPAVPFSPPSGTASPPSGGEQAPAGPQVPRSQ